jgi:hypothetical protein
VAEHYTKNTVTATAWCKKCGGFKSHRIDGGRVGPCLTCVGATAGALTFEAPAAAADAQQVGLFAAPAVAETNAAIAETIPVQAETVAPLAETAAIDADAETGAEAEADAVVDVDEPGELLRGSREQERLAALTDEFVEACKAAGFDYRGYGDKGGDRRFNYSRRGAVATVFVLALTKWDHTAAMLDREARKLERWLA